MDYIGIIDGNVFTILLPIHLIIHNIEFFIKMYYEKYLKLCVFFILVPYARLFNLIGGGANSSVDKIAKVLLWILGLTYIFLNKMVMSFFYNKRH